MTARIRDLQEGLKGAFSRKALPRETCLHDTLLECVSFADTGNVGKALVEKFRRTGCRETFDRDLKNAGAAYRNFYHDIHRRSSFANRIVYGLIATRARPEFMDLRNHEMFHALQFAAAPVLFAHPFSYDRTGILPAPEDFLRASLMMEFDAYAKQMWIGHLCARKFPEFENEDTKLFASLLERHGDIGAALAQTGRDIMGKTGRWNNPGAPETTLYDYYCTRALNEYDAAIKTFRDKMRACPPVIVRMGDEEARAIGNSFGPNPFGRERFDDSFRGLPPLSDANNRKLEELNRFLGISGCAALRTFGEVLKIAGKTEAEFVDVCRMDLPPQRGRGAFISIPQPAG